MSEATASTIEVIAERIHADNQPYSRSDPYKVGVVIQGGAMRGVIGAGAIVGLESLMGDAEPFDRADMTSGGAFSWAALASRNGVESTSVYYEELAQGFISLKNRLQKGKIVDLSLLMRTVTEGPKAFDFDRILSHPTDTSFYATSLLDATKVEFKMGSRTRREIVAKHHIVDCRKPDDVALALESTAHLPYYAGLPVRMSEELLLVDGGVTAGRVPLQEAIDDDCTHILVVSTDRNVESEFYKRRLQEKLAVLALRRSYPYLARRYWEGFDKHVSTLKMLRSAEAGQLKSPDIGVIRIADKYIPRTTETDPKRLYAAAKAGEHAILDAFSSHGIKRNKALTVRPPRQ